jgi:hypothetical protein
MLFDYRWPTHGLCCDPRGRDAGVCQELAAGIEDARDFGIWAIGGRRSFTLGSIVPLLECTDWPDFVASACVAGLTWLMRATA